MSLEISVEKHDELAIIRAVGELDYHNFRQLKSTIEECLEDGRRNQILDLSKASYLDSAALGSLLYSQKRIHDHHGHVILIASDVLKDVLNLTHLDTYFRQADSVEQAQGGLEDEEPGEVIPFGQRTDRKP